MSAARSPPVPPLGISEGVLPPEPKASAEPAPATSAGIGCEAESPPAPASLAEPWPAAPTPVSEVAPAAASMSAGELLAEGSHAKHADAKTVHKSKLRSRISRNLNASVLRVAQKASAATYFVTTVTCMEVRAARIFFRIE